MTDQPSYTRTVEWDTNRDNAIDNVQITDYWTDNRGNILREETRTDSNNDGRIDFTQTTVNTYTDDGLLASARRDFDNLTDDRHDQASLEEFRYQNGEVVWFRSSSDFDANGTWDATYTQETTLDDEGRVIEAFSYTDWDANGAPDVVVRSVYEFNSAGVQTFAGHDYDNDGTFNYTDTVTFHDPLVG